MEAAEQASAPKKPRLVFTDLQRRTLQAIFKVQPKTRSSSAPLLVSLNVSKHEKILSQAILASKYCIHFRLLILHSVQKIFLHLKDDKNRLWKK